MHLKAKAFSVHRQNQSKVTEMSVLRHGTAFIYSISCRKRTAKRHATRDWLVHGSFVKCLQLHCTFVRHFQFRCLGFDGACIILLDICWAAFRFSPLMAFLQPSNVFTSQTDIRCTLSRSFAFGCAFAS